MFPINKQNKGDLLRSLVILGLEDGKKNLYNSFKERNRMQRWEIMKKNLRYPKHKYCPVA